VIEIYISKGVFPLVQEAGYKDLRIGDNVLDLDTAMALEAAMWNAYQTHKKNAKGRAAASLSRNLATAIECTRSPKQVEAEILTVLDGKWDDEDAIETHIQLMVHRGWDRVWALRSINKMKAAQ
jgi:hypothetical protein